jgi:hypothetical protein
VRGRTHRPKTPQDCPEVIADLISKVCTVSGSDLVTFASTLACCCGGIAVPQFYCCWLVVANCQTSSVLEASPRPGTWHVPYAEHVAKGHGQCPLIFLLVLVHVHLHLTVC